MVRCLRWRNLVGSIGASTTCTTNISGMRFINTRYDTTNVIHTFC
jgi:hypothetical protein